jgi:hypothetical protein
MLAAAAAAVAIAAATGWCGRSVSDLHSITRAE